jgi:hypothetical protein
MGMGESGDSRWCENGFAKSARPRRTARRGGPCLGNRRGTRRKRTGAGMPQPRPTRRATRKTAPAFAACLPGKLRTTYSASFKIRHSPFVTRYSSLIIRFDRITVASPVLLRLLRSVCSVGAHSGLKCGSESGRKRVSSSISAAHRQAHEAAGAVLGESGRAQAVGIR